MKKINKKGFTIVELVIVIAVIAILAAVLIPTFSSLVKTAQTSSDVNLVKNLNTSLTTSEILDGKNETITDALNDVKEDGFDVTKLTPTNSDNEILWDEESNRFVLYVDEEYESCGSEVEVDESKLYKLWKIYNKVEELELESNPVYSIYWNVDADLPEDTKLSVGFDAGTTKNVSEVIYENTSSEAKEVVIRTNGGTLTINAATDTVKHYGSAKVVTLTAVSSSSYYEHGVANLVDIKNGRLVITNDASAEVGTIYLTATNNEYNGIILATQNGSELPEVVARESVDLPTGEAKKLVVTIQTNVNAEGQNPTKTEEIYLYPASDVKEETNGYNVSDLGMLVVEAISSDAQTQAAEQITNAEVLEAVKEAKTSELETIAEKATLFAGGKGTAEKPYLISDVNELEAFRDAWNAGLLSEGTYFALSRDIDMTGRVWTPIGDTSARAFSGTFDGQGYTISNLTSFHYTGAETVTSSSGDTGSPLGLFGFGYKNVTIKNITVDAHYNEYDSFIGGVMGVYFDENNDINATYNVLFDNINVTGIIAGKGKIGGILGSTYSSDLSGNSANKTITIKFNKCINNAKISGDRIGGIAGTISGQFKDDESTNKEISVTFVECVNNQAQILSTGSTYKSGGIAGFLCGGGNYTFTNCTSVAIENGGKLFGRIHDAGAYGWTNPELCEAHSINYIYGMWNTYKQTTAYVSVLINSGGTTYLKYTSGHALASDEWRLTINGKQYKCNYNTPINSAEDCTEMTGDHLSNPTAAEFSDFFVDDTYEVGSVNGNNVYLVPKE